MYHVVADFKLRLQRIGLVGLALRLGDENAKKR